MDCLIDGYITEMTGIYMLVLGLVAGIFIAGVYGFCLGGGK